MPEKGYVDVSVILDRSGSMEDKIEGTISGFNEMLKTQKAIPGKCTISLFQFDDVYEEVYKNISIHDAKELNKETFVPRNMTALLDAMGKTINDRGNYFNNLPEDKKPEKVIIVVLTDGYENRSREFKKPQIARMIKHQTDKYGWEFLYIGSDLNTEKDAASLGISLGNTYTVPASSKGMSSGADCFSYAFSNARTSTWS